jgi:predicted Fe-Mo cluster-binding NifX family protein
MRIAVTIDTGRDVQSPVCQTFGRAPRFLVLDDETGLTEVIENTAAAGAHGAGTGAASLLARTGVGAVISGRFGPNAFAALEAAHVRMYLCGPDATAGEALGRLRGGALESARSA